MTSLVAVVSSTVGWPALQLAIFWIRFHRLPPGGALEALVFVPMGFVAGLAAAALLRRADSARQRGGVTWGYLAASPVALLGSLLGGLVLPGIWGPLAFGAIPLILGSFVGYALGGKRRATA